MSDDPATREVTATCRTDGCPNAGIAIPLTVPDEPEPHIACGPCGLPITDVT